MRITHPDKRFFSAADVKKSDLADYYLKISPWLLHHIRDRPLTLERYPDGIGEEGFMQQEAAGYFGEMVGRAVLERKDGSKLEHVLCSNSACLVRLANFGVVTLHMWLSRVDKPGCPDRMVFDLDPADRDFSEVRQAAVWLGTLLDDLGIVSYVMTTGSSGAHIVVPLDRRTDFDEVRRFAADVAALLAAGHDTALTVEQRKEKRGGRLYLDVMRNGYGQTGVVPYTLRAVEGATVATPLDWDEFIDFDGDARSYTIDNIFRRLGQKGDPWRGLGRHARSLKKPRQRLDRMIG